MNFISTPYKRIFLLLIRVENFAMEVKFILIIAAAVACCQAFKSYEG